jgi:uncharacterized protein (TIGR03083 family)
MSGAVTSGPDTMRLARDERADLADFLATLTPEQWDAPTLCTLWRVRDVVAHIFSYEDLGLLALVRRFAAARFNADRVNAVGVAAYAEYGPAELLARVREHLQPSGLTARFGGQIALTDGLIHHQDIRRALALPREVALDRVQAALRFAPGARPIGAPRRLRGLRLAATDLDWSTGDGPSVEGPGEALLMAMAGRPAALPELSGPGTPTLAERITSAASADR